jgi:amino acid transporter
MAETPANDADPLISVKGDQDESTKSLGRIALISIVFFLVCGGSYGTEDLGGAIPPFFGLLGIICVPWLWSMPIALITAELGSSMPNSGGFLLWIRRGLGDFLSYLDALIMVITIVIDLAVYPLIFISYTESLIQFTSWEQYLLCVAFIILCLGINMFGAGSVGNSSKVFTLLTLIPFGILIVFASISPDFDPNRWMVTEGDWDAGLYLSVLIWATCGYEYAGFLIGDVKNAKKTFPLAMASTVGLMTLTYLLPVGAIVAITVDPTMLSEGAYPIVAENLGGRWLALVFTGGGLVSSLGTYNAYLHTASAALSSFSEDGYIPKIFSRTLPKFNTPFVSMLFFT